MGTRTRAGTELIFLALLSIGVVEARGQTKDGISCLAILQKANPTYDEHDYEISDAEGLFLDIIEGMAAAQTKSGADLDRHLNQLLKMKAQFLNRIGRIVWLIATGQLKSLTLEQPYNMIVSLGADPSLFGFVEKKETDRAQEQSPSDKNKDKNNIEHQKEAKQDESQERQRIGFIQAPEQKSEFKLEKNIHRQIGYGATTYRIDAPPKRKPGRLQFKLSDDKEFVIIFDEEAQKSISVSVDLLHLYEMRLDSHHFHLMFNSQISQWVITRDNLANPNGTIGFQPTAAP